MMWNLAFILVSAGLLIWTVDERPNVPVRLWIYGYAFKCLVHVGLVWFEYCRRAVRAATSHLDASDGESAAAAVDKDGEESANVRFLGFSSQNSANIVRRCESVNTMVSFLWWIVGFYWDVSGGDIPLQEAPRLYWLSVVFLAFDVFFAIFCVVLACLTGIALCCCLPCIIAILYSVAGQEGASDVDLSILPKYKFRITSNEEKPSVGAGLMIPAEAGSRYIATERVLLPKDATTRTSHRPYLIEILNESIRRIDTSRSEGELTSGIEGDVVAGLPSSKNVADSMISLPDAIEAAIDAIF